MSKILLMARNLALNQEAVRYTLKIARASGAEVECLHLASKDPSTAEWMDSRPRRSIQRLKRIRAGQTTAEWTETLERLKNKERERIRRRQAEMMEHFKQQGIALTCHEVRLDSGTFLRDLRKRMPVDLMIGERLRFPAELTHEGIMTIGDLGARFHCTAIDGTIMRHLLRRVPRAVWKQLAVYGSLSLVIGFVFFPHIEDLTGFYMSGGVLPALGIMASVALVAWVYGRAVESLLKLTKLDVY